MAKQREIMKKEVSTKLMNAQYQKMNIISLIVLVGFFLSIVFHYALGYYLGKSYPYNTIFFIPSDFFNDFYNFYKGMALSPPMPYNYSILLPYFPATHLMVYVSTFITINLAYLLTVIIFYATIIYQHNKALVTHQTVQFRNQQILLLSFFSYPFLFVVDRGNVEIYLYIVLFFFFHFYYKSKNTGWSTVFLVLAINMKLYPATLLILLISDKKYKQLMYTLLLSVMTLVGSYYLLSLVSHVGFIDTITMHLKSLKIFDQMKFTDGSLTTGHALWGIIHLSGWFAAGANILLLSKLYVIFVFVFFIIIALYVIFIEKIRWKIITLLIFPMILFPFISFDYTLIHVYFPLLFLLQESEGSKRENIYYAILFSILLIPVNYFYIRNDISISTIIYPTIMLIIIITIIIKGTYNRFSPLGRQKNQ